MADLQLPDWHVLGDQIREDTILAPGGGLQTVHEVPYHVDSGPAKGSTHTVRVDPRDFTPAGVQEIIEQHLGNVHGVAQLGNGVA